MARISLLLLFLATTANCARSKTVEPIEFLTREGCIQTTVMRERLDEAIKSFGAPLNYTVVDLDTLPASDVRRAYPTPTVLSHGADLFGMAEQKPPYPAPT